MIHEIKDRVPTKINEIFETRLLRYFIVGLLSTATHFGCFYLLFVEMGWGVVLSTTVAFLFSLLVSFSLNRAVTFSDTAPILTSFPKFILVALAGLLWNASIMYVLVDRFTFDYRLAFIAMAVVVFTNNFLLNKHWVFRTGQAPKNRKTMCSI